MLRAAELGGAGSGTGVSWLTRKGTLPLIERHFAYDKSRFVVVDPEDKGRKLLDERGIRFIHQAVTRDNYRTLLRPLLTEGGGHFRREAGNHGARY